MQELTEYVQKGALNLRVAFSRDQDKKVYVTHLLQEDADKIWEVIGEKKGHVYICGLVSGSLQLCMIEGNYILTDFSAPLPSALQGRQEHGH